MYMALMALLMIPRGIVRAAAWLVMCVVGWLFAATESLYAAVTYNLNNGILTIEGDVTNADTIIVDEEDDSVIIWDNTTKIETGIAVGDVDELSIAGHGGDDSINVSAIDPDVFTALGSGKVTLDGGDGDDTILGRDFDNGDDTLIGGDGADSLLGLDGFDDLYHYTVAQGTNSDGDKDTLDGGAPTTSNADFGYRNGTNDEDVAISIENDNSA